ncbi:MAG: glutamine-hydrolyzing carbamoyl-phosphate synthase small subunit [Actinomycetota bacterium]
MSSPARPPPAVLVLEDGTAFRGRAFGAVGEAFGEAVFNTAMCGYQEVLTDPSYTNQIVAMTSPHQGNYGVNADDAESDEVRVAGFAVRAASRRTSSWRAVASLGDYLADANVVGIEGIDTRALTLRIRQTGAMRAGISTEDLSPASLAARVRRHPEMDGADLAASVSIDRVYEAADVVGPARTGSGGVLRVAAYDFGMKRNILRCLAGNGCEATIFPATTPASEILAGGFDGVFLSNGPGDPSATSYGIRAVSELLGKIPIFGICLGHQLLALALEGRTYKLRFGHRGVNQPVKDLEASRVEITSHNHGFAVDPDGWGRPALVENGAPPLVHTSFGRVALTHWNLNDGTLEGLRCLDVPAFSVQYHPEAAPGPHDARDLFVRFRELMS